MEVLKERKARFDTRLSEEQKLFFERAARIGGYGSLSNFVILTVQKKAKEIIAKNEQIIASKRDRELFFDGIINLKKPNEALLSAAKEYKSLFS